MSDNVYILQKDLPDGGAIGDFYAKFPGTNFYYNVRIRSEATAIDEGHRWETWQVENNPEWFLPEAITIKDIEKFVQSINENQIELFDYYLKKRLKEEKPATHSGSTEQQEKDWKIVAFKMEDGQIIERRTPANFGLEFFIKEGNSRGWLSESTCMENYIIHSVKRQDGKVFTVGNKYKQGTVKSMRIGGRDDRFMYVCTGSNTWNINLLEDEPLPQPQAENKPDYSKYDFEGAQKPLPQPKPDWEIMSLRDIKYQNNVITKENRLPFYEFEDYFTKYGKGRFVINSVLRQDGEVFSIGDEVGNEKVVSFWTEGKDMMVKLHGKYGATSLSIKALTKKQKLFTTEDGKGIFEGDEYWAINIHGHIAGIDEKAYLYNAVCKPSEDLINLKFFSTKEAAEKYIAEQKPKLQKEEQGIGIIPELEIASYDYSIERINKYQCPITAQSDVQSAYIAGALKFNNPTKYTQQQVDEMCEKAFGAAKIVIGTGGNENVTQVEKGIIDYFNLLTLYKNYQDYKSKSKQ